MFKTPNHIKLLELLEQQGVGYIRNISPWFYSTFPMPDKKDEYIDTVQAIRNFINDLSYKGYISWKEDEYEMPYEYYPQYDDEIEVQNWFQQLYNTVDSFKNLVYLNSKGLDYLEKYRSDKILKIANYAAIALFVPIFLSSAFNVVISANALKVSKSALQYEKHKDSLANLKDVRIQLLQQEVLSLQSSLRQSQTKKTFQVRKPPIHQPSVSGK
jgi:hypothetical protein